MSLLSSFLANHLIPSLESALISHEPEAKDAILAEVKALADQVGVWLGKKIDSKVSKPE